MSFPALTEPAAPSSGAAGVAVPSTPGRAGHAAVSADHDAFGALVDVAQREHQADQESSAPEEERTAEAPRMRDAAGAVAADATPTADVTKHARHAAGVAGFMRAFKVNHGAVPDKVTGDQSVARRAIDAPPAEAQEASEPDDAITLSVVPEPVALDTPRPLPIDLSWQSVPAGHTADVAPDAASTVGEPQVSPTANVAVHIDGGAAMPPAARPASPEAFAFVQAPVAGTPLRVDDATVVAGGSSDEVAVADLASPATFQNIATAVAARSSFGETAATSPAIAPATAPVTETAPVPEHPVTVDVSAVVPIDRAVSQRMTPAAAVQALPASSSRAQGAPAPAARAFDATAPLSAAPAAPATSASASAPLTPATLATPVTPVTPLTSLTPVTPVTPVTPGASEAPVWSEAPVASVASVTPETSVSYPPASVSPQAASAPVPSAPAPKSFTSVFARPRGAQVSATADGVDAPRVKVSMGAPDSAPVAFQRPATAARPVNPLLTGATFMSPLVSSVSTTTPFESVSLGTALDQQVTEQIVQTLRMQMVQGGGEARIELNPNYLGRVQVSVKVENGTVTANVVAETAEVREWVSSRRDELSQTLAQQGLRLDRLDVAESQKSQSQQHREQASRDSRQPDREAPRQRRDTASPGDVFELQDTKTDSDRGERV